MYTMLLLLPYRSKEGKPAVVRQCQGSLESVYNQCTISMSEIFKLGGSNEPVYHCISTGNALFGLAIQW